MRVVLDNNVLVSAVITPHGLPGAIFQAWRRDEFQLILSAPLLTELARVLAYDHIRRRTHWSPADEDAFLALLASDSIEVTPETEIAASRDVADNRVLEAALAGDVDYIVTGDQDLLTLSEFSRIPIVAPTRFLTLLRVSG